MDINKIQFKNVQYALEKEAILHFSPNKDQRREKMVDRDYTIIGTLGQGGFGITYLATTKIGTIQQIFAIKEFFYKGKCSRNVGNPNMIFPEAAEAKMEVKACLDAFKKEAGILHEICEKTPNIVKVNEVFDENNTTYYVMEYLEDGNLREVVKNGALRENIALSYILPVAEAVSMLHTMEEPFLHCDIKHDNIMLRKNLNGEIVPVLIDFGEVLHFNKEGDLTTTHNIIGCSRGFAPLEQYAGVTRFSPTIDVYALAATLYYLVTGDEPPFAGEDNIEDLISKRLPASISDFVRNAIIHGIRKDKINRTATVTDFIKELGGKIPPPPIADELQPESILENKNKKYIIKSVEKRTAFFIQYKVWAIDREVPNLSSTMTERISYDMYEFFDKNNHDRISDKSVIAKGDVKAAQQQFLNLCKKITKNQIDNEFKEVTFESKWVTFKANNTQYIVDYHYKKPFPWKKTLSYAGIIVGCLLLIYTGISIYNSFKEANIKEREQMSLRLTNAIATNNADSLRIFAEDSIKQAHQTNSVNIIVQNADSLFYAAKLQYENGQLLEAQNTIRKIDNKNNMHQEIKDFIIKIEQKLEEEKLNIEYTDYLNKAQSAYKSNRYNEALTYVNKIQTMSKNYSERNEILELIKKISLKLDPSSKLKDAQNSGQWNVVREIALTGYSPACGVLAKHYLGEGGRDSHCRAYYWAQKASKEDKNEVLERLEYYGFLDENYTPLINCDNINY